MTPTPQPVADERLRAALAYAENNTLPYGTRFIDDALRDLATAYRAALARAEKTEQERRIHCEQSLYNFEHYDEARTLLKAAESRLTTATARAEAAEQRERTLRLVLEQIAGNVDHGAWYRAIARAALTTEPTT